MQLTKFGDDGVLVSRLGFGAMGFAGWFGGQSEAQHIRALHVAMERGVNFIDTARAYGESERIVGAAINQWSGPRPFVATKVAGQAGQKQWGTPVPVETAYPKGHCIADCERSLKELGLEQIDLLQLHTYWASWGTRGHWLDDLLTLKQQGKIRYIGVSIPDHRSDMALALAESGAIDSIQTIINIFDPLALEMLVPACAQNSVAVIARCVLDEGGLTGFLKPDTQFDKGDFRDGYFDLSVPRMTYITKVDRLRRYIPKYASSLAALALRFVLQHPGVTTAISSMHVERFAQMNIDALEEGPLPDQVFTELFEKHRWTKNFADFKNFGVLEDTMPRRFA